MAKAQGKKANKGKKQIALLEPSLGVESKWVPTFHIDMPLEELEQLKLGQEVTITVKGCIKELRAQDYGPVDENGALGIEVYSKTLRKTSNAQAEGIRKLSSYDDED